MLSNDKLGLSQTEYVDFLDKQRGKIYSKTGGWFPGKGVFSHGFSMLEELVGKKSYMQILILNATGTLVERKVADWVEAIYGCLSWPDPRIWCNQIGALSGSARTSALCATTMGCLATDSRSYGVLPLVEALRFIQTAMKRYQAGQSVESIVDAETEKHGGKPYIVGYKRPIAKGDERLETMENYSHELGFEEGEHLRLAYDIEAVLLEKHSEGMNIAGYMAGFLSDLGFSPEEVYNMFTLLVGSGVTACYLDSSNRPKGSFLPLRCDDVEYTGVAPRSVPE